MGIHKIGSNNFRMPKRKRTITNYIRHANSINDLDGSDAIEYQNKYGRYGTLGRTKRKSVKEFLKEKYGQK